MLAESRPLFVINKYKNKHMCTYIHTYIHKQIHEYTYIRT